MVVIMPSFSERNTGEQPTVFACVSRSIPGVAKLVGERVDGVGAMIHGNGRDEKPPNQQLPAAGAEMRPPGQDEHAAAIDPHREYERDQHIKAIEPAQFRESRQVGDHAEIRSAICSRQEPAQVTPQEPVTTRRVSVLLLIGVPVVMAVVRRPPQGAALDRTGAEKGKNELPKARGLEGPMGKVAMIEARNGEHPQKIQGNGHGERERAPAYPQDPETHYVHRDKGQAMEPAHPERFLFVADFCSRPRIKPTDNDHQQM